MTAEELELMQYATHEEKCAATQLTYKDPNWRPSSLALEGLRWRKREFFQESCYTVAYAMRNL